MFGSVLAALGLLLTAITITQARDQLRHGLEQRYIERFWAISDDRLQAK